MAPEPPTPDDADAVNLSRVETAAKGWDFRVVVSADLAGAGPRFRDFSEGLGTEGGEVFQQQVRGFIIAALEEKGAEEGVWQWTGDGAKLAFSSANRAHDFAVALHYAAETHNRPVTTAESERHFRVGMAATDDRERESWDYTVMRAVRLESEADADGNLIDVETWAGLHSTKRSLYGSEEAVFGKRADETYKARRHPIRTTPNEAPEVAETKLEESEAPDNPRLHNLPPDAAHFKGRGKEEAALLRALKRDGGTQAITALKGIGGIGKTALAVRIARQLIDHYPAAQILVNLHGTDAAPLTPRAAMEEVIRRFEPEASLPDDEDLVAELYRGLLSRHKSLLILDNAGGEKQLQSLLPPPPSAAIVTSRRLIDLMDVTTYRLDDLDRVDAITFLSEFFLPSMTPRTCRRNRSSTDWRRRALTIRFH